MCDAVPVLPSGIPKLKGGIASRGWVLCWWTDYAAAWSPSSGWIPLPRLQGTISLAHPTNEGVLVLDLNSDRAGFWTWGSNEWSWLIPAEGLTNCANLALAGEYLVYADVPQVRREFQPLYTTDFRICSTSRGGFQEIAHLEAVGAFNLVCAATDRSPGDLIVGCSEGLFRLIEDNGQHTLEKIAECTITSGPFSRPAISGDGRSVVFPTEGPALDVDLSSGAVEPLALGDIDGCDALWRALLNNDLDHVPLILEALELVPVSGGTWDRILYDVQVQEDLSATIVSPQGVLHTPIAWTCSGCGRINFASVRDCIGCNELAPDLQLRRRTATSLAALHKTEVLTWRLEVEAEQALPESIDELLKPNLIKPELLARAVKEAAEERAGAMVLDRARGKNPDEWLLGPLDGVQSLFQSAGPSNTELLANALKDSDPAVCALALIAASTTMEDGSSALWGAGHPIPEREIRSLLRHECDAVTTLAAEACAVLKLSDCESDIGRLLDHPRSLVRPKAVESLGQIQGLSRAWRDRIATLIVTDQVESVREAAIEVTAKMPGRETHLDSFINALGDIHYEPRLSARSVVSGSAILFSADQFFRVIDILILLLMSGNVGEQIDELSIGIADMLDGMVESLAEAIGSGSISDAELVESEALTKLTFSFLVALFSAPLVHRGYLLDEEGFEGIKGIFDSVNSEPPITDAEYEVLRETNDGVPPLAILKRVEADSRHRLVRRLAVLSLFTRRADVGRHFVETTEGDESGEAWVPLHVRLRGADSSSDPLRRCRELVEDESSRYGLACLPALYSLAAIGTPGATERLVDKLLDGECPELGVLPAVVMQLLQPEQRRAFMERLLLAEPIPLWHRFHYFESWDAQEHGELDGPVSRRFLRSCSTSGELVVEKRLEAARLLADLGEPEVLEQLWEGTDPDELDPGRLYEYSKDMARAGHEEFLVNVRGVWVEKGDLEALKSFAAAGTEDDLAEVEHALEQNAPEQMLRDTMDAIRTRLDGKE